MEEGIIKVIEEGNWNTRELTRLYYLFNILYDNIIEEFPSYKFRIGCFISKSISFYIDFDNHPLYEVTIKEGYNSLDISLLFDDLLSWLFKNNPLTGSRILKLLQGLKNEQIKDLVFDYQKMDFSDWKSKVGLYRRKNLEELYSNPLNLSTWEAVGDMTTMFKKEFLRLSIDKDYMEVSTKCEKIIYYGKISNIILQEIVKLYVG